MKKLNILSFIVISIFGTLSHFIYEWSGNNKFVGYFSAVNESTWEHLKLLFFPSLIYYIFEYFILKNRAKNFISSSVVGIFSGMLAIVVTFYSYRGILGYNIDFLNILIYYIGVVIMIVVRRIFIKNNWLSSKSCNIVFSVLLLLSALNFIVYTYSPLTLGIFTPPVEM